jgi:hypothetical protein
LNKKSGWSADVVTLEQGQMFWLLGWSNCTRIVGYVAGAAPTKFKTTLLSGDKAAEPGVGTPTAEAGAP